MKVIICFISVLSFLTAATAQPNPDTLWTRTYGGDDDDYARYVQQTTDGGYIVAGYKCESGEYWACWYCYLMKTDSNGDTLWTRKYGSNCASRVYSAQQTSDGGYIMAGISGSDCLLIKLNSIGDTLWTRLFGGDGGQVAYSVIETADGGYILAGNAQCLGIDQIGLYLIKTDADGDTLWTRVYCGSYERVAFSIQQTTDGGYIVTGITKSALVATSTDCYLVKVNCDGDTLWTRTYGGPYEDQAYSVLQTVEGGYLVAGYTSFQFGNRDFYIVNTDNCGDTIWTRRFDWGVCEEVFAIQPAAGGYIMAGIRDNPSSHGDFCLLKIDFHGNFQWMRIYGGQYGESARSVQETADGGFILAGELYAYSVDYYLVKTGPAMPIPPLYVVSPNGDEGWSVFSRQNIRWVSDSVDGLIRIELNHNYPLGSWEVLVDSTEDDNNEAVVMNPPLSDRCRIRISLIGDTLTDVSDTEFAISTNNGILHLVTPEHPVTAVNTWSVVAVNEGDTVVERFYLRNFGSDTIIVFPPLEPVSDEFHSIASRDTFTIPPSVIIVSLISLHYTTMSPGEHFDTLLIPTNAGNADEDLFVRIPLHGQLITSIGEEPASLPKVFALHPAYPNPFNAATRIAYDLPQTGRVSLSVFNLQGQKVATLVDGFQSAGAYSVQFDGSTLASGVYLYRLQTERFVQTRKMVLLK